MHIRMSTRDITDSKYGPMCRFTCWGEQMVDVIWGWKRRIDIGGEKPCIASLKISRSSVVLVGRYFGISKYAAAT